MAVNPVRERVQVIVSTNDTIIQNLTQQSADILRDIRAIAATMRAAGVDVPDTPTLSQLNDYVMQITAGYMYGGVAHVDETVTPDICMPQNKVFFFAYERGTYPAFGNLTVGVNEFRIFLWTSGEWSSQLLEIASTIQYRQVADIPEANSGTLGNVIQWIGADKAQMADGTVLYANFFYKVVNTSAEGEEPIYAYRVVFVQPYHTEADLENNILRIYDDASGKTYYVPGLAELKAPPVPVINGGGSANVTQSGSRTFTITNEADPEISYRYTTDGSEPNKNSTLYTGPVSLNYDSLNSWENGQHQLVFKAIAVRNGLVSTVTTATYTMHRKLTLALTKVANNIVGGADNSSSITWTAAVKCDNQVVSGATVAWKENGAATSGIPVTSVKGYYAAGYIQATASADDYVSSDQVDAPAFKVKQLLQPTITDSRQDEYDKSVTVSFAKPQAASGGTEQMQYKVGNGEWTGIVDGGSITLNDGAAVTVYARMVATDWDSVNRDHSIAAYQTPKVYYGVGSTAPTTVAQIENLGHSLKKKTLPIEGMSLSPVQQKLIFAIPTAIISGKNIGIKDANNFDMIDSMTKTIVGVYSVYTQNDTSTGANTYKVIQV